jgi:hypothetical protein
LTAFSITDVHEDGMSIVKTGQIKVSLRFKEALTEAVNVIVFASEQSIMRIDRFKNVSFTN